PYRATECWASCFRSRLSGSCSVREYALPNYNLKMSSVELNSMSCLRVTVLLIALAIVPSAGLAQVFGTIRVSAHDPQGLALADADVVVKAEASAWTQTAKTNAQGERLFVAVPIGHYAVTVRSSGFRPTQRDIEVTSNSVTPVALQLEVAGLTES